MVLQAVVKKYEISRSIEYNGVLFQDSVNLVVTVKA